MAKPSSRERLSHILATIQEIEVHTAGLTLEEFKRDRFRQHGIERCLEIISEATRHVPPALQHAHPEIPWVRVADLGNRIRHAYHAVDSEIIWEIVVGELKQLKAVVETMMRDGNAP